MRDTGDYTTMMHMDLPHDEALRWLVSHYAGLRAGHGEDIGTPELVEPSGRFFPDAFRPDGPSVARLLKRVLGYAPVSDEVEVALRFVEQEGQAAGGCGTGACGTGSSGTGGGLMDRVTPVDDAYIVDLPVSDVGHPTLLTTSLVRSAGAIVLSEAGEDVLPEELGAMSELAASVCGFGVLLTNGAYVYGKSCGGVRVHTHTHLSVAEHAVLLALFCKIHDVKPSVARAHLEPTPLEAFAEARAWVDARERLVTDLREHPSSLVDGVFPSEPARGLLGRLFGGAPRSSKPEAAPAPAPRRERSEEEQRRLAEAKALVDEALREG
jgi:hypothetical protein